eukprot:TRINITY_DN14476_c0_g2_i1.p1 TRINITY_DN14476_c0_g2~~TRINITY_DN14476_c0_g2_i1.p1  ORF type:complete len:221 (+),score=-3.82 TRINITY_DN14476_c0_g2_i1:471-1133(+)
MLFAQRVKNTNACICKKIGKINQILNNATNLWKKYLAKFQRISKTSNQKIHIKKYIIIPEKVCSQKNYEQIIMFYNTLQISIKIYLTKKIAQKLIQEIVNMATIENFDLYIYPRPHSKKNFMLQTSSKPKLIINIKTQNFSLTVYNQFFIQKEHNFAKKKYIQKPLVQAPSQTANPTTSYFSPQYSNYKRKIFNFSKQKIFTAETIKSVVKIVRKFYLKI